MLVFEHINRLQILHSLIVHEATGTPHELAEQIHLSKRQLYNLLDEFKDMGADIRYSRNSKTFYYNNDFQIELSFKVHFKKEK